MKGCQAICTFLVMQYGCYHGALRNAFDRVVACIELCYVEVKSVKDEEDHSENFLRNLIVSEGLDHGCSRYGVKRFLYVEKVCENLSD